MIQFQYTTGTAAFVNLAETEVYDGKDTGAYGVVLTLEPEDAETLEEMGIRIKDYNDTKQRKFKSKYQPATFGPDGNQIAPEEVTWGSKVKLKWSLGNKHPQWGVTPYLKAVKVIEFNELGDDFEGDDEEF